MYHVAIPDSPLHADQQFFHLRRSCRVCQQPPGNLYILTILNYGEHERLATWCLVIKWLVWLDSLKWRSTYFKIFWRVLFRNISMLIDVDFCFLWLKLLVVFFTFLMFHPEFHFSAQIPVADGSKKIWNLGWFGNWRHQPGKLGGTPGQRSPRNWATSRAFPVRFFWVGFQHMVVLFGIALGLFEIFFRAAV